MSRNRRNGGPAAEGERHRMENVPLNGEFARIQNFELGRAQARAEEIVDDPGRVNQVIVNARARQDRLRAVAGNIAMDDIFDMMDMLRHAENFQLRRQTQLLILGSLIYVASPIDLVPDVIPFIGYLDDIGILALTVAQIRLELAEFRTWRANARAQIRRDRQQRQRENICPNCIIG